MLKRLQRSPAICGLADNVADLLQGEETPGSILLVTDGVDDADIDKIRAYDEAAGAAGIVALVVATEGSGPVVDGDGGMCGGSE